MAERLRQYAPDFPWDERLKERLRRAKLLQAFRDIEYLENYSRLEFMEFLRTEERPRGVQNTIGGSAKPEREDRGGLGG